VLANVRGGIAWLARDWNTYWLLVSIGGILVLVSAVIRFYGLGRNRRTWWLQAIDMLGSGLVVWGLGFFLARFVHSPREGERNDDFGMAIAADVGPMAIVGFVAHFYASRRIRTIANEDQGP
jgi:hypothetical protein